MDYSDGSIMLNVSGGLASFSYNWSGPNSFSEITKDIFNLSPGTYNLTITDITSLCIKDTFFVVGAGFDMQTTSSSTDISCYGFDDGTIDVNPINLINPLYTWSDISTSFEDRINISPGIYYLQIDDNNCFVRDTFIITQPDSLFIISQHTTSSVCLGGNSRGDICIKPSEGHQVMIIIGVIGMGIALLILIYLQEYMIWIFMMTMIVCLKKHLRYYLIKLLLSSVVDNIDCFGGSTGSIDYNC